MLRLAENAFNGLSDGRVFPALLVLSMASGNGLCWVIWDKWRQGRGINGCAIAGVDIGGFVSVIVALHSDFLLSGFVLLGRLEAIFIKIGNLLQSSQLIQS